MKKLTLSALAVAAVVVPATAYAAKDSVVLGMRLEPRGLDPRAKAEAAISQITLYNLYEGLTRINKSGEVTPGLAESWTVSDDQTTYTFNLRKGVKFHDGTDFDSGDVKWTFEANAAEDSTNKRKKYFTNMASIETPDAHTVRITLKEARPTFLFNMGETTAIVVGPESAASNGTKPVGTGPFEFSKWVKGDSVTLTKSASYRDAGSIKLSKVTFKFINDASAQVAALLSGDVDVFPNFDPKNVAQFKADPGFEVLEGTTEGETILSTNNKSDKLKDIRVRQAIAHALNRQEIIDGAMFGAGTPIGTHFAPHNPAYVDLINTYPYDPAKAKALLKEAGHGDGLTLSLKLPPPTYARDGGQIVAAQLAKVGIKAEIQNVEWPVWLKEVYKEKNYDLSIVSHVEPNDIGIYTNPKYYFQYDSQEFRDIMKKADSALDPAERTKHLQAAQRKIAEDAVNGYLFQFAKVTVVRKGLQGVWQNAPVWANDMAAISWSN